MARTLPKDHEDHLAEKGFFNSWSQCNLVHKMNILDAKAAVDKEWEKLEKLPALQMTEVKNKESWPGDGVVPEASLQQAAADPPRVPNLRACVLSFFVRVAHAGWRGRIRVLPWYRLVCVAITAVRRTNAGGKTGLLAKFSCRHDSPHLSLPNSQP